MDRGDIDILLMDKSPNSLHILKSVLYKEDRALCFQIEDHISIFLNAGPQSKEFIMLYDFVTLNDLSETEKYKECIFCCLGNKTYITVLKTEKSDFMFDLVNLLRFERRVASSSEKGVIDIMQNLKKNNNDNNFMLQRKSGIYNLDEKNKPFIELNNKLQEQIISLFHLDEYVSLSRLESKALASRDYFKIVVAPHSDSYEKGCMTETYSRAPQLESQDSSSTSSASCHEQNKIPKYPKYADKEERLRTFKNWMYERVQDPKTLSNIGFFWTQMMDLVRCFYCGLGLKDFTNTDDPLTEHIRYSENCEFLVNTIDEVKINRVKAELVQTDPEFCRRKQWQDIQNRPRNTIPQTSLTPYRHPHLSSMEARKRTYVKWPQAITQTPEQLARAGLFYTGTGDIVRCWACDGGLQKWDPNDDPWIEHCRWFPACPFALSEKGEEFVRLVQHAVETRDETKLQAAKDMAVPNQDHLVSGMRELDLGCTGHENADDQHMIYQLQEMGFEHKHIQSALTRLKQNGKIKPDTDRLIEEMEILKMSSAEFLKEENERLRSRLICEKCKKANREALFLPCKHLRMCMKCSETVFRCPVCDENIIHRIKTYIS